MFASVCACVREGERGGRVPPNLGYLVPKETNDPGISYNSCYLKKIISTIIIVGDYPSYSKYP